MKNEGNVALISEMMETPDIIRNFDFSKTAGVAKRILEKKRVFISGEGSSRILPARNFISEALRLGVDVAAATDGSYQGCEYDLSKHVVLLGSNSGQTKETITLLRKLVKEGHKDVFAFTNTPGSVLDSEAHGAINFSCGKEHAVAASKSVVDHALTYQSILCNMMACGTCASSKAKAGDLAETVLTTGVDQGIVDRMAGARMLFIAGRNNGVAEEMALKTTEITRKPAVYLEGTIVLHGYEEIMSKDDVVIFIEPYETEYDKMRQIFVKNVGAEVIAVSSKDTPFRTVKTPLLDGYSNFLALMVGWNMLIQTGQKLGVNLDKPNRARKVGNAI